jgi:hypothetical protein
LFWSLSAEFQLPLTALGVFPIMSKAIPFFCYQLSHWSIQEQQAETPSRNFFTVVSTLWKTVRFPGGSALNTVQNYRTENTECLDNYGRLEYNTPQEYYTVFQ